MIGKEKGPLELAFIRIIMPIRIHGGYQAFLLHQMLQLEDLGHEAVGDSQGRSNMGEFKGGYTHLLRETGEISQKVGVHQFLLLQHTGTLIQSGLREVRVGSKCHKKPFLLPLPPVLLPNTQEYHRDLKQQPSGIKGIFFHIFDFQFRGSRTT